MLPGWNYSASLTDEDEGWVVVLRAILAESTTDELRPIRAADSLRWVTDPTADPEDAFGEALKIAAKLDQDHRMVMRSTIKQSRERWRALAQAA